MLGQRERRIGKFKVWNFCRKEKIDNECVAYRFTSHAIYVFVLLEGQNTCSDCEVELDMASKS